MATSLLGLAVPGLGAALELLNALYTKYDELRNSKVLCKRLGDRLTEFGNELKKMSPATIKGEEPLQQLVDLINKFYNKVIEYTQLNVIDRITKHGQLKEDIETYNEKLDYIIKMVTVNHTDKLVRLLDWRNQFELDYKEMTEKLTRIENMQREIWKVLYSMEKQASTNRGIEDLVVRMKRDLVINALDPEGVQKPIDSALRTIIDVAESKFLGGKDVETPPTWLIASDEVRTQGEAIDTANQTKIYMGEWNGVTVAIKKFDVIDESPVFDKHFHVWRSLLHPHVAQLFGAGSDYGAPFFVYEYASRRSLDLCCDEFSMAQIWSMLHQAAMALSYLHKRRVVHGNLSCSKLLVTEHTNIKVYGFGASFVQKGSKTNSIRSSIRKDFAAPECIGIAPNGRYRGDEHGPRIESDVYTFGLTIIEAITKKSPFEGMLPNAIRELKQTNDFKKPEEMSNEAWTLVQQMCVVDPKQRVSMAYVTEQLGSFAHKSAPGW